MPIRFHYEQCTIEQAPKKIDLMIKDNRYDPLIGCCLFNLSKVIENAPLHDPINTPVIGLTSTGCLTHLERVRQGVLENKPRQAFFARAGPQMLATYAAMALDAHGPTCTLICSADNLSTIAAMLESLVDTVNVTEFFLLGGDYVAGNIYSFAARLCLNDEQDRRLMRSILSDNSTRQSPTAVVLERLANHVEISA